MMSGGLRNKKSPVDSVDGKKCQWSMRRAFPTNSYFDIFFFLLLLFLTTMSRRNIGICLRLNTTVNSSSCWSRRHYNPVSGESLFCAPLPSWFSRCMKNQVQIGSISSRHLGFAFDVFLLEYMTKMHTRELTEGHMPQSRFINVGKDFVFPNRFQVRFCQCSYIIHF